MKPVILLIDDEEAIQFAFTKYLGKSGYEVITASTLAQARIALTQRNYDIILLDLSLPDGNGLEMIGEIRQSQADVALVVITGKGDVPLAVKAMQLGADNFMTKPTDMDELEVYLRKSMELKGLRRQDTARKLMDKKQEPFFGKGAAMKKVLEFSSVAAGKDCALILHGETGTGKGVLARWIHDHSVRSAQAFVEVNCSALKGDLLNSELFGHAKGAFTSAHQDRPGLFEVADGGTLFLDEIGDMELAAQAQFLKVIEEKQYRRLGEVKLRHSDFRLICATNRDLLEETKQGRFRLDLYYRINVFPIYIPALRERTEDLEMLVKYLLFTLNYHQQEIPPGVIKLLRAYNWPGNIRELKNILERGLLLAQGNKLEPGHFTGLEQAMENTDDAKSGSKTIGGAEGLHIKNILAQFNNDTVGAAKALGISRPTLYRKIKKYKLTI
ncbi:sigma-54-dependent Fis family transcriptional regulator [candidate division TA06 bacterium]|nr:sigma-54-dependent Fis family transcriptional regulator [candidate division TA06 bacterium]